MYTEKSVVRNESEDWKLDRIVISQSAYLLEIQYLGMFKEDSNIRVVSMWYMWENFCIDYKRLEVNLVVSFSFKSVIDA